jgi:hypothetical protein
MIFIGIIFRGLRALMHSNLRGVVADPVNFRSETTETLGGQDTPAVR